MSKRKHIASVKKVWIEVLKIKCPSPSCGYEWFRMKDTVGVDRIACCKCRRSIWLADNERMEIALDFLDD